MDQKTQTHLLQLEVCMNVSVYVYKYMNIFGKGYVKKGIQTNCKMVLAHHFSFHIC